MAMPPASRGEYLTAVATAVTPTQKIGIGLITPILHISKQFIHFFLDYVKSISSAELILLLFS
jgi:hypothetical protein